MKWLAAGLAWAVRFLPLYWTKRVRTTSLHVKFRQLWQHTWLEEGYATTENIQAITEHHREFDGVSADFVLFWLALPVGTIRVIKNSSLRLPLLRDFAIAESWEDKCAAEITLLTVRPLFRQRSHIAFLMLARAFYRYARQNGFRWIGIAADVRLFHSLQRWFAVTAIGEGQIYEGSYTIPACLDLAAENVSLAKRHPRLWRWFTGS